MIITTIEKSVEDGKDDLLEIERTKGLLLEQANELENKIFSLENERKEFDRIITHLVLRDGTNLPDLEIQKLISAFFN